MAVSTLVPHALTQEVALVSLAGSVRPSGAEIARGRRRLQAKAIGIAALAVASYFGLVFSHVAFLARVGLALALVVAIVAIGTGIMHDANHGAFSTSRRVNRLAGYSADVVGASSVAWRFKHNNLHHANTNIAGLDTDIDQSPFARLAPDQPWRPWHRFQHVYLWVLYGFLSVKWLVVSDIYAFSHGGYGDNRFPTRPTGRDVALMYAGKLIHVTWAVAIPLFFFPWWGVLGFYLVSSWLVGFTLAMVFQLAHCTGAVDFPSLGGDATGDSFELRQLRTTADIQCRGRISGGPVRWIMGGLDHQVEHHLLPRVPHTMYAQMGPRLRALCAERGLPYHEHETLGAAVRAHGRWLRELGRRPVAQTVRR
jgi:linoleoyl-CoA desaturase